MNTVRNLLQVKGYDVWSIGPDATVFEALRRMESKGIGALLVMDGDRLAGILSERDYARKVILQGKNSNETRVCEIMTVRVFTIHPDQTLDECMDLMTSHSIRHLPVVEGERVIGVISIMDVVRAIIHRQRFEISQTEPRSYGP
ncbi:MAG: CBS domain-containing protein [Anaerolineaceae bacterium]|nr:CBS domain-containing protein [Anaerolineaceae bacterium]